jgi:outer membrane protein OmpA-like peptidoglycan-associated protein
VGQLSISTAFDEFIVKRAFIGDAKPTAASRQAARLLLMDLVPRIEGGEAAAIEVAIGLTRLAGGETPARSPDPSLEFRAFSNELLRIIEAAVFEERLLVECRHLDSLSEGRDDLLPDLPPLSKPPRASSTHSFEVRLADEVGTPISGIDALFTVDGEHTIPTNGAGVALLDGMSTSSASVAMLDVEALTNTLEPRWETLRPGAPPKAGNTQEVLFRGRKLGPFSLKAEIPNTIIVKPPLGRLFVELFDKTGRVRHAQQTYQISGPQSFEGTTNDQGILLHENVFPGNYSLSLALEFFEAPDPDHRVDIVESSLVVLEPNASEPQVRLIGPAPWSVLAQLHLFFNTNKAFLLPTALPEIKKLRRLYLENAPCELLVVGHADTRGGPTFNDKLSLERAEAIIAYLKDDVEAWFARYSDSDAKKCWGKVEDHLMIMSMPGFGAKPAGEDEVSWFQRTRGLKVDGTAGKDTRHALIEEYMGLDGTSLTEFVGEIVATAHGCGENFPLDDAGELDDKAADEKRDPSDRRVELFFFNTDFGITPKPPGPNSKAGSKEYPLWRKRVVEVVELRPGDPDAPNVTFVEIADAHFRTNSAVVLPEGESPSEGVPQKAVSAVGLIATALRFNEEHPGRSLVVAGHTDTAGGDTLNDELSLLRARVALALLEGDRDTFKQLAQQRHKNADINQILSWISRAFDDLSFDCRPSAINDAVSDQTVRRFQRDFNRNKPALGSSAADLGVDGEVGELTWGAFFDCYEFALRQELGEDAGGVAGLRSKLKFVDPDRKALGFGERFPVEELGVDQFRSQLNRRAELLFFEPGEEPDLADAEADPDTAELYLPGNFERTALPVSSSGRRNFKIRLLVGGEPIEEQSFKLLVNGMLVFSGSSAPNGLLLGHVPDDATEVEVQLSKGGSVLLPVQRLAPADTTLGAQRRLLHLGYFRGEPDGADSDDFLDALRTFQEAQDLAVTRALDPSTAAALRDVYGS